MATTQRRCWRRWPRERDLLTQRRYRTYPLSAWAEIDATANRCSPIFDLWLHDDVSEHADAILASLQAGTMPCDGPWSQARVDLFQHWAESGKQR